MTEILILIAVLVGLVVLAKLLPQQKNTVGSKCKSCPEFPYCGGGRPRCARRSESTVKTTG